MSAPGTTTEETKGMMTDPMSTERAVANLSGFNIENESQVLKYVGEFFTKLWTETRRTFFFKFIYKECTIEVIFIFRHRRRVLPVCSQGFILEWSAVNSKGLLTAMEAR